MSVQPIDVQMLIESGCDGGGFLGWYAKGHHDKDEFCAVVNYAYGLNSDDRRHCRPVHVRHVYYRTVPIDGGDYREFRECKGPARGAWACTVADILAFEAGRRNEETKRTADSARREALNWVLSFMDQNVGRPPAVEEMRKWAADRCVP